MDLEENMLDSENEKDYYKNYKDFCKKITNLEKEITKELSDFKGQIKEGGITIGRENKIKTLLQQYKNLQVELETAYSDRNAPRGFPFTELDKRQKDIQQFGFNYERMEKQYNSLYNTKYSFKGGIDEDYSKKEEYLTLDSKQLISLEKDKLAKQDDQLDEISHEVKKNITLAKDTKKVIKDQNKQLEEINEDMDRTNEKMKTMTGRFENYVAKSSWCKLIVILIIELIIGLGAYLIIGL